MNNIYFVGGAGSGKSILTSYLVDKYNYIHGKMACPIYAISKQYFNMKKKDRKLLQCLGKTGRINIDRNIWLNRLLEDLYLVEKTYHKLYKKDVCFCLDDVRYCNEHETLKSEGWIGIYLNVDMNTRINRLKKRDGDAQLETLNDDSETELNVFKNELIEVDASGTLQQSYDNLERILKCLNEKK